jgi:hypothetical protein
MIAAAEVAEEPIQELLLIKFVLTKCRSLITWLLNEAVEDKCTRYETYIWEIHRTLCQIGKGILKSSCHIVKFRCSDGFCDMLSGLPITQNINEPTIFVLWGQALLKLARTYFVPQVMTRTNTIPHLIVKCFEETMLKKFLILGNRRHWKRRIF